MDCALNELYGLGYDFSFSTPDRMNAVTEQDIREAAASLISPGSEAVSIVLPEAQTAEPAE